MTGKGQVTVFVVWIFLVFFVIAEGLCQTEIPTTNVRDSIGLVDFEFPAANKEPLVSLDSNADERMRRVVKILRTSDKAQVNQFVPVVFELKNVNPYAVVRFIDRVVEIEEGNWWTFVAPDNESGRLLVNVPLWQVEPLKELVALIDRPQLTSSDGAVRVYHHLNHRDPGDHDFLQTVEGYMTRHSDLISDRATGALYLYDIPSGVDRAMEHIKEELDVPTKEIILRSTIYEVDLNNDGTLGLDFHAWKNGPGRNLLALGAFADYVKTSRLDTNGVDGTGIPVFSPGVDVYGLRGHKYNNEGYNVAYFYNVPTSFFDFLVTKGRARVLTAPRATVLNTKTVEFSTGEQILFYRVQTGASDLAGSRPEGRVLDPYGDSPNFTDNRTLRGDVVERAIPDITDAGVELFITPVIGENAIVMDIKVSVVSQLSFDDSGVPMLHHREVATKLNAAPGEEYIIGGLTRTRAIQTTRKIPILGSLPVLGWLFGGEISTAKKTLLAIVVSADVVTDFSGMNEEELEVVNAVSTKGMDIVSLPEEIFGFDMMLIGNYREK